MDTTEDTRSPFERERDRRRGTEGLVSWGRASGQYVNDGRTHIATDEHYDRTLCGRAIPAAVRSYMNGADYRRFGAVFPNDAAESARLDRCASCARIAARTVSA